MSLVSRRASRAESSASNSVCESLPTRRERSAATSSAGMRRAHAGGSAVPPTSIGTCLLRTNDLADSRAWRGWKQGSGFTATFVNPYIEQVPPSERASHICDIVGDAMPAESLTYSPFLERYLVVGEYHPLMGPGGFYFSTSTDLLHRTAPRLLSDSR
jgi:hypothetical protein